MSRVAAIWGKGRVTAKNFGMSAMIKQFTFDVIKSTTGILAFELLTLSSPEKLKFPADRVKNLGSEIKFVRWSVAELGSLAEKSKLEITPEFSKSLSDGTHQIYVAVLANKPVATCFISTSPTLVWHTTSYIPDSYEGSGISKPSEGYIYKVYTSPEVRSKGIASQLIHFSIEESIKSLGLKSFSCLVYSGNFISRSMFQTLGFGRTTTFYLSPLKSKELKRTSTIIACNN